MNMAKEAIDLYIESLTAHGESVPTEDEVFEYTLTVNAMLKIPSLTPQKVISLLERKGFVLDRTKGSHRIYFHPETKKRVVVPFHR
jgi:predicted RNA binding protein YcfA (HicA-like mRNA interferase family)